MKESEYSYYTMFRNVSATMHKNENIWGTNPYITACVSQLDTIIDDIINADTKLGNTTKNITTWKKSLRESITSQAFLIKDNMRFYFQINNNTEEMQLLTYPISKLMLMTDSDFFIETTRIRESTYTIATQLLPFGITKPMIYKLKKDLLELYKITPERELLSATNANLVKLIPAKKNECRLMLNTSLDTLVKIYKKANSGFIIAYKNSRKLPHKPGTHKHYTIIINGKLTQINSTDALANVIITAGKKQKTTTTDINGNYTIKIYTKDADTITFTHPGFETQTIAITLIEPEKHKKAVYTINAEMVKEEEI